MKNFTRAPVQALGEWVIIKPINKQDGMNDGIHIPEGAQDSLKADSEPAIVISAGEDCPEAIVAGATIYVLLGSCLTLPVIDGQGYLMCKKDRVGGVKN